MLKIALAAQSERAADPAAVLLGLNQALCGKFQRHYVTAAYVFFDMEKRALRYAGAGHPPILRWNLPGEAVQGITENGLFLGMFDTATYTAVEMPISAGEWFLMYTDGVPETTNKAEVQFGDERFRQFLCQSTCQSADQFADKLLDEVSDWSGRASGEDLDDDITVVAIRILK
jgi:serine phosphatase RsbU (regulator of sigma subunit)